MKKFLSLILSLILLIVPVYAKETNQYNSEINYLVENGVVEREFFDKNSLITYSEYGAMLISAFNVPQNPTLTQGQKIIDTLNNYTLPNGQSIVPGGYISQQDAIALAFMFSENTTLSEKPENKYYPCGKDYEPYIYTVLNDKILEQSKLYTNYETPITRNLAAYILAKIKKVDTSIRNNIVKKFVNNNVIVNQTATQKITEEHLLYLKQMIDMVPSKVLKEFEDRNFKIYIVNNMGDMWQQHFTAIGVFSMSKKSITISLKALEDNRKTLLHEFGHFTCRAFNYTGDIKDVYNLEAGKSSKYLREYASKNYNEYFADLFQMFMENKVSKSFVNNLPNTYALMEKVMFDLNSNIGG